MKKASYFNRLSRYLVGPGLAALLTAAPVWAGDKAPAQGDAGNTQPETTLAEVRALTRNFDQHVNTVLDKNTLSTEERELLNSIKKDVEEKTWSGAFADPSVQISFFLAVLAAAQSFYFYLKQNKDAVKMKTLNTETREAVAEQKRILEEQKTVLEEMKAYNEDYIRRAEKITYASQFNSQTIISASHISRTARMLERRMDRNDRIGKFPELIPYGFERLQTTRELAVLTMPFFMFGALGNPAGLHELHAALYEHFSTREQAKKLVIIIYDDESRASLARRRYIRGYDALRLMSDRAVTETFLKLFRGDIAEGLGKAIDDYRRNLKREDRGRIYELAKIQMEREESDPVLGINPVRPPGVEDYEAGDGRFHDYLLSSRYKPVAGKIKNKSRKLDDKLFRRVIDLRRALGNAMAEQELIYFGAEPWDAKNGGSPWPPHATVIRINGSGRELDNKASLFIDGKEIIEFYSDMSALDARGNKVVSLLGRVSLDGYKDDISVIFDRNKTPGGHGLISKLEKLIKDNSPYKSPEYDLLGKFGKKAARWHLRDSKKQNEILRKLGDPANKEDSNPKNEL